MKVNNLDVTILSISVLIQIIVNSSPEIMVNSAAVPWKRFQNKVKSITTENVEPIPAQTYPTMV